MYRTHDRNYRVNKSHTNQRIEKEIMATIKIIKSFLLEIEMWIHKDFDPIVFQ